MISVAGIFTSQAEAEQAVRKLQSMGIGSHQINVLSPGEPGGELGRPVSTTEAEQPGVGKAFGGLVGGALGAAGGLHLGATAASLLLPGVGPVIAIGVAGAALLGAGGALGGAAVGEHMEVAADQGLPRDELFVYEDALRKGRTVLLLLVEDASQEEKAQQVLESCGAESLNAARDAWWIGLRDAEAEQYRLEGRDFQSDESDYRLGFEAAQRAVWAKGKAPSLDSLRDQYSPDVYSRAAFRRGYERGQVYRQALNASGGVSGTKHLAAPSQAAHHSEKD